MQLTPAEIQNYLSQGYSMKDINEALASVNAEDHGVVDPRSASRYSSFASKQDENLIKWQLELNEMLERAEHILRGDILKWKEGSINWVDNPNPDKNILNDEGVQEIMRILSMYLNRNTILSDYEQDVINNKMYDFGKELNDLYYMRYEKLFKLKKFDDHVKELGWEGKELQEEDKAVIRKMIDNELSEKVKNYPMLMRSMIDIVHSAYQRALDGGERRSLREARQVQQTDQITGMPMMYPQPKRKSIIKPWTWFGG